MEEVQSIFAGNQGGFYIRENDKQLGEMTATIKDNELIVHHTTVLPEAEGKGFAKKLLNTMAEYARQHKLQVIAECIYVQAQFKRHMELYADIWKPEMNKDNL